MADNLKLGDKAVLVCDCEGTMTLDGEQLARACGRPEGPAHIHTNLCGTELARFIDAARDGAPLVTACTQEIQTFDEALEEAGIEARPTFVNVRERAGWSDEAASAGPKIAALLAEAVLDRPAVATVGLESRGICLVYGRDQTAIDAARQLEGRLNVSVLLTDMASVLPLSAMDLMVATGVVVGAAGHLGNFEVQVNRYAPVRPSSRSELRTDILRDGAAARCDLILDLSGGAPLFPSHQRRDGYKRVDPGDPAAVQRALFEIADMVGEFEKPRYVDFHEELCAHARSRITGCTRCLDACPASAIAPDGDTVAIDPYLCGGCGACNSVCPTGAAAYAYPPTQFLLSRVATLLNAYRDAGGSAPAILVHDAPHGAPLIEAMARFGRGLPAATLPLEVNEVTQVGLDFLLSALSFGVTRLFLLVPPARRDEIDGLAAQVGLAETMLTGLGYESGLIQVLVEDDPARAEAALFDAPAAAPRTAKPHLPQSEKRTNLRLAAAELHAAAPAPVDRLPLAAGAPFGAVEVDTEGCTLCLACVSTCPTGALNDNPDRPQLSFQEGACIQCGLCKNTCPEKVITLSPRYDFTEAATEHAVVYEEDPFECISCGKPFASKSTIEKMLQQLGDKHWMFKGDAMDRLKMCEDCRVTAQFSDENAPFRVGERPRPRTTDDYLEGAVADDETEISRPAPTPGKAPRRGS